MLKLTERQVQFMAVAGIAVALYMLFGQAVPAVS